MWGLEERRKQRDEEYCINTDCSSPSVLFIARQRLVLLDNPLLRVRGIPFLRYSRARYRDNIIITEVLLSQ